MATDQVAAQQNGKAPLAAGRSAAYLESMSMLLAYEQLKPVERQYVDGFMRELETRVIERGYVAADYIAAGMPGMEDAFSNPIAQRALVRAAIAERAREIADSTDIVAYKVLREIKNVAMSNMRSFVDIDDAGYFTGINLNGLTRDEWAAVSQIELEEKMYGGTKLKIKMHDKLQALQLLCKNLGLFDADNAQRRQGGPSVPSIPADASQADAAEEYARYIEGERA